MKLQSKIIRLLTAALLIGSLGACAVYPAGYGYRSSSVYVESYPTYSRGPAIYYERGYGGGWHRPPPPPPPGYGHHHRGWGWH